MNRDDMLRRLEAGEDPLELSIKKWQDIVDGKGSDGGVVNCALCERYYVHDCEGCPVNQDEEHPCCEGTPYHEYANADRGEDRNEYEDELKQFAQKELDFLKSLRKR